MARRVVCWFSCGAASAVAAHLTLKHYHPDALVVYCDTMISEHPDNRRFFDDVQSWLGKEIKVLKSQKYANIDEVFTARRYLSGIAGAPCTVEMKKIPRFDFQRPDDLHIFGYTADETKRIARFEMNNPELDLLWTLRDMGYSKKRCLETIAAVGIKLPEMYDLGYRNNICLGCVKAGSVKYWAKIRKDFPEVFAKRVAQSRELGARLLMLKQKRVFLDELPPGEFKRHKMENISCGPECGPQPSEED